MTIDLCRSLRYCISWQLEAPSNLTCKDDAADVRVLSVSHKSCWETVSTPSAMGLCSVDGEQMLRWAILINIYIFNISRGILGIHISGNMLNSRLFAHCTMGNTVTLFVVLSESNHGYSAFVYFSKAISECNLGGSGIMLSEAGNSLSSRSYFTT